MRRFSFWPIRVFDAVPAEFPDALVTAPVGVPPAEMPPDVALLLPTAGGATDVVADVGELGLSGLGLFLADPNLVSARLSRQIARRTGWVCNFPSVGQHEHAFRRYLAEVDLDHAREMRVLAEIGAAGLATIATVSAVRDVDAALAAGPRALLVVPPVPDVTSGAVPLTRRVALEGAIARRAADMPILGLRGAKEPGEGLSAGLIPPEEVSR